MLTEEYLVLPEGCDPGKFVFREKQLEKAIVEDLRNGGFVVDTQVRTRWGFADIVVRDPLVVIEVKRDAMASTLWKAVGQLCFYGHDFPESQKYIATPEAIDPDMLSVLGEFGIGEWSVGTVPMQTGAAVAIQRIDADGVERTRIIDEGGMDMTDYRQVINYWSGSARHAIEMCNGYTKRANRRFTDQMPLPFPEQRVA